MFGHLDYPVQSMQMRFLLVIAPIYSLALHCSQQSTTVCDLATENYLLDILLRLAHKIFYHYPSQRYCHSQREKISKTRDSLEWFVIQLICRYIYIYIFEFNTLWFVPSSIYFLSTYILGDKYSFECLWHHCNTFAEQLLLHLVLHYRFEDS